MARLIDAVERRPQAAFAGFLVVHGLVWTALPSLLYFNLPVDVIEAMTYGREWQLGYDKLPPLPWWLVEAAYRLFGTDAAIYALGQARRDRRFRRGVADGAAADWRDRRAGRDPDHRRHALFQFQRRPNSITMSCELPFWALAGFAFHAGLRHGRLRHWILLGLALGLAWWAKYFVVILAAPLALFLLVRPRCPPPPGRTRPLDRGRGGADRRGAAPDLAGAAPISLPFSYAEGRAAPPRGVLDHLLNPAALCRRPGVFSHSPAVDRGAAVVAAVEDAAADECRRVRPPHRHAVGVRPGARRCSCFPSSPAAPPARCGAFRFGCSSAFGSFFSRRPRSTGCGLPGSAYCGPSCSRSLLPHFSPTIWCCRRSIIAGARRCFPASSCPPRSRSGSRRRPGSSPNTSSARRGTAAMSRIIPPRPQPRVLVDGLPAPRAMDRSRRSSRPRRGSGMDRRDPNVLPRELAPFAPNAEVGKPFDLPFHRGDGALHVGWAILPPQPR